MDGMLSQDEINALLAGMDTSAGGDAPADAPADGGGDAAPAEAAVSTPPVGGGAIDESLLTDSEKDAIGEVANISMGSSATTLYSLVNQKVNITTPQVELANWENVINNYERPCVFIQIKYTVGLDGTNILILKEHDVMVITDLMMGGDGTNTDGEIGELQLSAISEAMNQMMGAAATSLSTMINQKVDISPPQATVLDMINDDPSDIAEFLTGTFVKISFKMQVGELVDSTLMQLYPIDFAKTLKDTVIAADEGSQEAAPAAAPAPEPAPAPAPQPQMAPQMDPSMMQGQPMPQMAMPQMQMGMPQMMAPQMMNMNIQPAQFQNFSGGTTIMAGGENIGIIKDVPLEVTVELGRTAKPISDILDFAPGTIIELDKVAGEPVDVLVNGKFVAKGEVVVIEESFGVRVTEIVQ
ncbi:flagellar motor switch protein FliN/FliY [Butyrivibrio hungatei DSM 14810]|uniref:Flagellar motor switch protein FliN/FliY n=1 Tax=Butyrivibrio hungatei DSM 14810 TaxID=1121132 RepID=A0A1M7SXX0_9FIRM|nr:flagellar motor switch phosphatase FliY [Butyrivibrio hungatei]SHN63246.1 flagellar motor switch protein FliN/FliY [Butyrivibrio hungatei DSM 14810]